MEKLTLEEAAKLISYFELALDNIGKRDFYHDLFISAVNRLTIGGLAPLLQDDDED